MIFYVIFLVIGKLIWIIFWTERVYLRTDVAWVSDYIYMSVFESAALQLFMNSLYC